MPFRCIHSFLPEKHRPHVRSETFGTPEVPYNATSTGSRVFGAAVIPLCSGSHTHYASRLHPPLKLRVFKAARPFTPRNGHVVTHMNCGIASCLNQAIDMTGLSPAGFTALSAATQTRTCGFPASGSSVALTSVRVFIVARYKTQLFLPAVRFARVYPALHVRHEFPLQATCFRQVLSLVAGFPYL